MMEAADLTEGLRNLLRNKAIKTATTLAISVAMITLSEILQQSTPTQVGTLSAIW
jgi:hypothetical protein